MMKFFFDSNALLFLSMLSLLVLAPVTAKAANNILLESKPVKEFPASHLPRWQKILDSYMSETYNTHSKNIQNWTQLIHSLQGAPQLQQLLRVNLWFKQFSYKQDNLIYDEVDYWASPVEFLTKGGDCEDFAIIKYLTLRQLGVPAQDMKISIVYDVYSGTDHAFLAVQHDGVEFILDNREKLAVSRYMKKRYKPHYAFNESRVWTYDSPIVAQKTRQYPNSTILPGNR